MAQGAHMLLGDNTGGETFSRSRTELLLSREGGDIESAEYFLKLPTIMKTDKISKTVLVEATDLKGYLSRHSLNYIERAAPQKIAPTDKDIEYQAAIVGYTFAQNAGISAGDTIEIYLPTYDIYSKMSVLYIAADEGIFGGAAAVNILTDFSSVGSRGQVNAVYINFTNSEYFEKYEELFNEYLPGIKCEEGNNETAIRAIVRNNTLLLAVGLIFVIAAMMLIQLTSYTIIARNRVSQMVIFKAAGATPKQTALILFLEVAVYGIVGGVFGLLIGRLIMEVAMLELLPTARTVVSYAVWKYILAFIIAVVVTFMAALVPVISTSKRSIRELSSLEFKEAKKEQPILFAVSSLVLIGGILGLRFLSGIGVVILSGLLVPAIAVWVSLAVPFVVRLAAFVLAKIKRTGVFNLSSMSIKRNRPMRSITVLLAVIIAFSFTVHQVVGLVKYAVTPFRTRYTADYVVEVNTRTDAAQNNLFSEKITELDGIEATGYFTSLSFLIPNEGEKVFDIYGVSDYQTLTKWTIGLDEGAKQRWDTAINPLVLNEDMLIRCNLKVGDTIKLIPKSDDFKDNDFTFTVVGVDKTITEYDRVGYVPYSALEAYATYSIFLINATSPPASELDDEVFLSLRDMVETYKIGGKPLEKSYALTFLEWAYRGASNLAGVTTLLTLLQVAIYAIGALGIINVSMVTIYDRRNELRLYRLSGMSASDYMGFSAGEALAVILAGGLIGLAVDFVINSMLPVLSALLDKYVKFAVIPWSGALLAVGGGLLFFAVWMGISLFFRKIKIVSINERFN